jgi:hypothetical protein
MENGWPTARLIHLPVHASWLNQIELYFAIAQRKALTPNDLPTLEALTDRLLSFGDHYRQIVRPFDWTFTRQDLDALLARIDRHEPQPALGAQLSELADASTSKRFMRTQRDSALGGHRAWCLGVEGCLAGGSTTPAAARGWCAMSSGRGLGSSGRLTPVRPGSPPQTRCTMASSPEPRRAVPQSEAARTRRSHHRR